MGFVSETGYGSDPGSSGKKYGKRKDAGYITMGPYVTPGRTAPLSKTESNIEIRLGARVEHKKFGQGVIISADTGSKSNRFEVAFDSGEEKTFTEVAFVSAMRYLD